MKLEIDTARRVTLIVDVPKKIFWIFLESLDHDFPQLESVELLIPKSKYASLGTSNITIWITIINSELDNEEEKIKKFIQKFCEEKNVSLIQ